MIYEIFSIIAIIFSLASVFISALRTVTNKKVFTLWVVLVSISVICLIMAFVFPNTRIGG